MNIVLLSGIFPPEPIVGAQTADMMARRLAATGHKVKVVTAFPSRPAGKLYSGYKIRLFQKERHPGGYEIIRCFCVPSSKSTMLSRFLENVAFGLSSALYLLFIPKIDVLYANTWCIFASSLMSVVARLRRIPYVIRVVDLYPESLASQNRIKTGGWFYRLLERIDTWIASGAAHITVLTHHFLRTYIEERGIPASKISIVPDWVDDNMDCSQPEESSQIRRRFGVPEDAFLAVYGGNIGVAAGVDTLIQAAALLPDVRVIVGGAGSQLTACQILASEYAPEQVFFFSPWPKEQTMPLYQAANVLVLTTRGEQSIASIPSKLIGYMLSARPIIAAGLPGSELARIVKESNCGWIIPPDDPNALAQTIAQVMGTSREELCSRGLAGREYALKHLTAAVNLPKMVRILENISSRNRSIQNA